MSTMNSSRPQPAYPCGQQDLYTLIETGWRSYEEHLLPFSTYKTIYTQTTADNQLAALKSAREMPDEASREEVHKTLRKELRQLAVECTTQWSFLDGYIMDGFDEEHYQDKRMAAGHGYYRGAQQLDWESVKGLMTSGKLFIGNNLEVLTDDGGMPGGFETGFITLQEDFEKKHQEFLQAEEQAKTLTDAKIEANNALYKVLTKMFRDGRRIFRKQAAIREQFMVERVLELIDGGGGPVPATKARVWGVVTDAETGEPVEGVTLRLEYGTKRTEVETGVNGKYNLLSDTLAGPMAGLLTATHPMYITGSEELALEPGNRLRMDIALEKEAAPLPES